MITESDVTRAEEIARRAHAGQFRRDGVTPYIAHVEAVVARLKGESPEVRATAWLHDVIEDMPYSWPLLVDEGVPEKVADSVVLLTHVEGESYEEYIDIIAADPIARSVKIADMLANLSDQPTNKQIIRYAKGLIELVEEK